MLKEQVREFVLKNRGMMSRKEVAEKSIVIKDRLFSLQEFQNALIIMFYVSKGNEVSTLQMMQETIAMGKRVAVPITDKENRTLIPSEIKSISDLREGSFGIMEPRQPLLVNPAEIELVIVPVVAFDRKCNRIGTGHGYYDRFLWNIKAEKIGLAYEMQIVSNMPSDQNDVRMNKIVTDKRVIDAE